MGIFFWKMLGIKAEHACTFQSSKSDPRYIATEMVAQVNRGIFKRMSTTTLSIIANPGSNQ